MRADQLLRRIAASCFSVRTRSSSAFVSRLGVCAQSSSFYSDYRLLARQKMGLRQSYDLRSAESTHSSHSKPTADHDGDGAPTMKQSETLEFTLCPMDEIKNGQMKEFEYEGKKVVVANDNNQFFAFGGKCTHYGAPLAKGAFCKGIVRCPWHGACFNVKSGDIEDYPGLDSLPTYNLKIEGGLLKLFVPKTALEQTKRTKMMCLADPDAADTPPCIIVGGGAAGVACAETLRQEHYTGRIVMISQEPFFPYDRTKLSKTPAVDAESIYLRPPGFYRQNGIEVFSQKKVVGVDLEAKTVRLVSGEVMIYKELVLATGGKPRELSCPGAALKQVCYLRSPSDGQKIAELVEGKSVVIIGSSFIGMELAAFVAKKAADVVVVGRGQIPFQQIFGSELGAQFRKLHESNGVKFEMGTGVKELVADEETGDLKEVVLENGSVLPAQVCVVGIGVVPSTDFVSDSGLELSNGGYLQVDEFMQTSDPSVFGCGDIVQFPLSTFGGQRANVQHWQMALKHGRTAALKIAGKEEKIHSVPFFWSSMFGKGLRYAGYGQGFDDIILHGSLDEYKFVAYYFRSGELVAVTTMSRDPVAAQIAECLKHGKKISREDVEKNATDDWENLLTC